MIPTIRLIIGIHICHRPHGRWAAAHDQRIGSPGRQQCLATADGCIDTRELARCRDHASEAGGMKERARALVIFVCRHRNWPCAAKGRTINHEPLPAQGPVDVRVGQLPPCPTCSGPLRLEWRFVVTGPAIVAGVMPNLSATRTAHLVCDACGFVEAGKPPNAQLPLRLGASERAPG